MSDQIKTRGLKGEVPFTFALLASSDAEVIRAKIEGPIGFRFEDEDGSMVGETSASFLNAVSEAKKKSPSAKLIEIDLNTPGGIFSEAVAIKTGLEGLGVKVRFRTTSISASAGAYLAVIGDEHLIAEDASMMIHQASGGIWGSAAEIKSYAESVEQVNAIMVKRLSQKSGKDEAEIAALIDGKDYWMTGLDAVAMGFADGLIEAQGITACADVEELRALNAPEALIEKAQAATAETAPSDPEEVSDADPVDPVETESADEAAPTGETDPEETQGDELNGVADEEEIEPALDEEAQAAIRAACAVARMEAKAEGFISARASLDAVRAALFDAMAAEDEAITTSPIRSVSDEAPVKTAAQRSAEIRARQHSKFH
jgi:ATP-dependent protease ClpP protease subunit